MNQIPRASFLATTLATLLAPLAIGCQTDAGDVEDGENDTFVTDGKDDSSGIADGSPEACAVIKLVNVASAETLDLDVGLSSRAASNLAKVRDGDDGERHSNDDGWYATLADVDAVRYVGPATFRRLAAYAGGHAEFACGPVNVQLLAFNDFHGNLKPPSGSGGRIQTGADPNVDRVDAGGAEYLATHLARLAGDNPHTTIVAAGDLVGASPLLSAAFHDEPSIEAMNLMGLSVTSVGNHEFDEGSDELLRMQYGGCHPVDGCQDGNDFAGAAFPFLAANVTFTATGEPLLPGYAVRQYGNARIGFIGLTLEGTPLVTTNAGVAGLQFADEASTINALVPELKARGVNSIVVLIHEGGATTGLYNECVGASGAIFEIVRQLDPAVQVVVSGHTHAGYDCDVDGRLITSAAHAGRLITDIDLTVDELTGEIVAKDARNVIVTRDVAKDAAQTALIARYDALVAPIANRVVGTVNGDLIRVLDLDGESTMGAVIADAQLWSGRADGAVAAFMNPGGVRADVLAGTVSGGEAPGQITFGEAFSVQPFGNNLISLDVTGAQLETMLEQQWSVAGGVTKINMLAVSSSVSYSWSLSKPIGDRIDPASIRVGGQVVNPTDTYRITVNSFLSDGGDGFAVLKQGTHRAPGAVDIDAFAGYLTASSPLAVPALDRVTAIP
jgi:5'-nucleotidase